MEVSFTPNPPLYPSGAAASWPVGVPAAVLAGSAINLSLFVAGTPKPKGRPRTRVVVPRGGGKPYAQIYTDQTTRSWEDEIENQIRGQIRYLAHNQKLPPLPISGRVIVATRFNLGRPKSLPKRIEYPVKSRTDADNLEKSLFDALQNAGVIKNDCLITDHTSAKRFAEPGHPEGIEVDLTGLVEY